MNTFFRRLLMYIGLAGGIFAVVLILRTGQGQMFCRYDDPVLCDFLDKFNKSGLSGYSGTYEETFNSKRNSVVSWNMQKDAMEIIHRNQTEEQMHLVLKNDLVYLKDYRDQKWWEQSKKEMDKFNNKLPFDPLVYQDNLLGIINDPDLKIVKEKDDICLGENCSKYKVIDKNGQELPTAIYISNLTSLLRKIEEEGDVFQEISFFRENKDISPPTKNIKVVSPGTNLFLVNFLERSEKIKEKPEHLAEIEKNLRDGTISGEVEINEEEN